MAVFNRSDMQYRDYKWTAYSTDDPKVTGKPDSTLFNRHEGYEVLYLINVIISSKSDGLKAERMIHDYLPSEVRSQENVTNWITVNWRKY